MRVAEEVLHELRGALAGRQRPAVRALHLPANAALGTKDGEFGALELEDGSIGLSYVLLGDTLSALQVAAPDAGLAGQDPLALASAWTEADPARRALGFAAVNALTRHLFDLAGYAPPAATDSLGGLDPRPGDHVGMVGLFPPLVPKVLAAGARLTVLERRADLAGPREGYEVTLDPATLAGCNKVLSTSTILLNASFDDILQAARGAQQLAIVGPGAGCLPDPLFRRGVTTLAGTWITDPAGLVAALASGAAWGANARKFALRREDYPGLAALLAGARP
jgi:uncharacterized protein (DUF4213/DUF364 family)